MVAMKQKNKLLAYLVCCACFVSGALYKARNSFDQCDKCHFYSNGYSITQPDPFLHQQYKSLLTIKK